MLLPTGPGGDLSMNAKRQTLHYVDWLRVGVISLVVAHHAAQAYGPTGGAWPVFEAERSRLLGPFFAVNAAFFMGLFFLISGYFVPGSLARKGTARFFRDRLVRLGIPLVVMGFVVLPPILYALGGDARGFAAYYTEVYIGEWQVTYGPLWFVFHLLVYGLVYAALAQVFPALAREGEPAAARHRELIVLTLAIAVLGGLARIEYPQGPLGRFPLGDAHGAGPSAAIRPDVHRRCAGRTAARLRDAAHEGRPDLALDRACRRPVLVCAAIPMGLRRHRAGTRHCDGGRCSRSGRRWSASA